METAMKIFDDCKTAIDWLENEEDFTRRRILWVSIVALLRSIGDALKNDTSEEIRIRYFQRRKVWKKNSEENFDWFYSFINLERNSVLHEYEFGHTDDSPIFIGVGETADLEDYNDIFWPLKDGELAGQDARDVALEALEWWRYELMRIAGEIT